MSRSDTACTLLILDGNPIIATIERQLRAHCRTLLNIIHTGGLSSQNRSAIFGRVRELFPHAAPSRLRKHDVALGVHVIDLARLLLEVHVYERRFDAVGALPGLHSAFVMDLSVRVRVRHPLGGGESWHDLAFSRRRLL